MSSFQTFFRTVVMLAVLGIVAKAWYLYGPSVTEMKTIGARMSVVVQEAWNDYWQKPSGNALANDPRVSPNAGAPAPFVPSGVPMQPIPHGSLPVAPQDGSTVQLAGGVPGEIVPVAPATASTAWPQSETPEPMRLPATPAGPPLQPEDTRLTALLEHLTQLGVRDQELSAWGSGGALMRFSCNVSWANSPAYSRHFEAVAATPSAAVEQVAAEIEAWRRGQR